MRNPTAKIRTSILEFNKILNYSITKFVLYSDSDNDNEAHKNESDNISPMGSKRRVTFHSTKRPEINEKLVPTVRQRRLRTSSRSIDERISFRGRNAIYTAGIYCLKNVIYYFQT
jgi:hypothetical protein